MSVPARIIPVPYAVPVAEAGPWSDSGGNSPVLALQRRIANEWSPAIALPETSTLATRIDAAVARISRIGGPILFGAALAGVASLFG